MMRKTLYDTRDADDRGKLEAALRAFLGIEEALDSYDHVEVLPDYTDDGHMIGVRKGDTSVEISPRIDWTPEGAVPYLSVGVIVRETDDAPVGYDARAKFDPTVVQPELPTVEDINV